MYRFRGLLAALLLTVAVTGLAQPMPVSVEFTVHAPGLPAGSVVHLTGDTPSLGNWAPDAVPMERRGGDTWSKVLLFNRAMPVRYRYTLGSEERRGADERGQPLNAFSIQARRNLVVRDEIPAWTDASTVLEAPGKVTGDLRHHRHLRAPGMPARDIAVWVPRFYDLQKRRDYPVLYLNDGQDLFDPSIAEGGRDWGVDEALARLIDEETIEPMIVVGIYSTEDRLNDFEPGRGGEDYMRFIVEAVKPLVDRRYRTRPGRQHTYVGGAAMGGVIAFATAWSYPEVFGAAISLSPAFRVEGRTDVFPWFEARVEESPLPVFFYLDSGSQGVDALVRPGVEAMADHLKAWGYRPERHYVLVRDLDAHHGPAAWSKRFPAALTRSIRGAQRLESIARREADHRHSFEAAVLGERSASPLISGSQTAP